MGAGTGQQTGLSVVLAGGGSAGHVNPLLSIASAIKELEPTARLTVIGTDAGLETNLVPAAGFELTTIRKVPFPRRPNLDALAFPGRWLSQVRRVRQIVVEQQADVVVGVGGYAAAPAYRAAHSLGLPLVVHEQNAKAGLANRLGASWADFVGTVYDNTGLKVRPGARLERVGLPLRPAIAELAAQLEKDPRAARIDGARKLGLDPDRPILLVTGGSLGAVSLNRSVAQAAPALLPVTQVVHLSGKGKSQEIRQSLTRSVGRQNISGLGPDSRGQGDYHLAEYLEDMAAAFACADLVLSRSGAGAVSEISALGLPAVYVPLPIGNGEQRFNAQPVVDAGGALLVADHDFTAEWAQRIPQLLTDEGQLAFMRSRSWEYGVRDAAGRMAQVIVGLAGGAGKE